MALTAVLEFGDNDFQKSLAELDLWEKRERTYKNFVSPEEWQAVEDLKEACIAAALC